MQESEGDVLLFHPAKQDALDEVLLKKGVDTDDGENGYNDGGGLDGFRRELDD